ncbi:hypothetical protein HDU91_007413 [Kappamyces sp. JEL0680]|nr:hypothetical protein HDU91_007413 [Kappamyces sp. JEL0680]
MSAPVAPAVPKEKKPKASFAEQLAKDFVAGGKQKPLLTLGVSGTVSKTLTAPIERVKLVIQTQDANPKIISGEVPRYTGIGNAFIRIFREQGLGAFWRGNFTNCIRYFPTQALNLASKDFFKSLFPKYNPKTEFWPFFGANMLSGGAAGAFSLTFVYPLDYARTRLASDVGSGKRQFTGLFDCIKKTAQGPKGFLSLYQAKETTFVGIASKWAGAQFSVIMSGYVTYPFDTVRRRLQMQAEKPMNDRLYSGAVDCLNKIIKNEGFGALFKGAGANILRGTGAALVLVLYGEAQDLMKKM